LSRDWTAQPPITIWRQPIGGGYAGFAVAGNIVVTIEQRRDNEAVVCYDQDTGRERWFHEYTAHFSESLGGPGPRATPTIFDGAVYSLGASGELVCLDGATGRQIWHVNILADTRAQNLQWGMAGSPLVFDELVVVNPGGSDGGVAAYDRRTGSKVWSAGKHKAGYSSPALATLGGYRQILVFDGAGLAGYDPAGSGELWRYPWSTMQDINVAQPLVLDGERVLISSGYGVGCALLRVRRDADRWSVEPVWPTKVSRAMQCKFTSPIEYEGFIYGLDDGIMVCVDPTSGSRCWKKGRYGHGQILLVGDVILVLTEIGDVALVEADPQQHRESARFHALDGKTWNTPALSGNRLFVRNHREMACYELPALVR
jgi:outer membrane protein assembly factor BamB